MKDKLIEALMVIGIWGFIIAVIAIYIYALVAYADTPIKDCPLWVVLLLGKR